MNKLMVLLLLTFIAGCTYPGSSQSEVEPNSASTPAERSEEIPSIQIGEEDRACTQDSDCEHIATRCACDCGEGVNKAHIEKYKAERETLCEDYRGKICKMDCRGSVKCKASLCTYTY